MNEIKLALGLSITLIAMLAIPVYLTPNVANACSFSRSSQTGTHSSSATTTTTGRTVTGSCGTSAAASGASHNAVGGEVSEGAHGACETRSISGAGVNLGFDAGFGSSVSCSSHSP